MANSERRTPAHVMLSRDLGIAIVTGRYAPGALLPGEIELAEQRGVSRSVVREALRIKVDAPLAELEQYKDGDWVTAGGIITACKKIRTKKGDPMMFATLDDLEGAI